MPSGQGVADPSPLTPSAGQTLTLEQMDNGLHALSPTDHTLLLPALATAFHFTSCCPSSLFLHLQCLALDGLNCPIHSGLQLYSTFYVFRLFPPATLLPTACKYITPSLILPSLFFISSLYPSSLMCFFSAVCLSAALLHWCFWMTIRIWQTERTMLENVTAYTVHQFIWLHKTLVISHYSISNDSFQVLCSCFVSVKCVMLKWKMWFQSSVFVQNSKG